MLDNRSFAFLTKSLCFAAAVALMAGCGGGSGAQSVLPENGDPTASGAVPMSTTPSFAVVQSAHAGGTYNSTITVKLAKAPIAGNVLVLFFEQNKSASFPYSGQVSWPSTETGSQWSYDGGTSETAILSHIVQSGESGTYTLNVGGKGSGHEDYMVAEISGASSTNPINARAARAVAAGTTLFTLGSGITPTTAGTLPVVFFTAHEGGLSWSSISSGWSKVATNVEYTEIYATGPVQTGTATVNASATLSKGSIYTGAAEGILLNSKSATSTSTSSPTPQPTATPVSSSTAAPTPAPTTAPSGNSPYTLDGVSVYTACDWFTTNVAQVPSCSSYAVSTVDPNSAAIIANFDTAMGSPTFNINGSSTTVGQNTPNNDATNSTGMYVNKGCSYGCHNDAYNDDPSPGTSCFSGCSWKAPWASTFRQQGTCKSGGDCHGSVLNTQSGLAYDMYGQTSSYSDNLFNGSSIWAEDGYVHNLRYSYNSQINGGSDNAGIPMIGTFDFGEDISQASINHILEVSIPGSDSNAIGSGGYVAPAVSGATCKSYCTNKLPMGSRLRLKASYTCPNSSTHPQAYKICMQLKTYGMIVIDHNGGGQHYVFGPNLNPNRDGSNPWNETDLSALNGIPLTDFDVLKLGTIH